MSYNTPVNRARTTVSNNALNNTTSPLSFTVADGSVFGSTYPVILYCESEKMYMTTRSGNTLTCTRASAVAHSGTPVIYAPVDAEHITELQTAVDAKLTSPLTTKGDILTYGTSAARLGVGTDGYVLTADAASTNGIKWAAVAAAAEPFIDVLPVAHGSTVAWTQTTGTWTLDTTAGLYQHGFLCYNTGGGSGNSDKITSSAINVPVSGNYRARVCYKSGTDCQKWRLLLNGVQVGSDIDAYANPAVPNTWTSFDLGALTAGTTFTLAIAGTNTKNSSSTAYYVAMQSIVLVKY